MIAILARSALMLGAAVAVLGWYTGWAEAKARKPGMAAAVLLLAAVLVVRVAGLLVAALLAGLLLAAAPHSAWMSPARFAIYVCGAVVGLWTTTILVQCGQNLGRRFYGLSPKPIEWVRGPSPARHKRRRAKAGAR